jgi:hypothetical protein
MKSLCLGAVIEGHDLMKQIVEYDMVAQCDEPLVASSLSKALTELEANFDKFKDVPESIKCYALWNSMPNTIQPVIRYQILPDGNRVEIREYDKLKKMVWSHATMVMEHIIKARASMLKAGLEIGVKRQRGQVPNGFSSPQSFKTYANVMHEAGPSQYQGRVQQVPNPPPLPAFSDWMCPPKLRSQNQVNNTYKLFVMGQTPAMRQRLMKEKKCLICKKPGHWPESCNHAAAAFKNETMFWYPESCIMDSMNNHA